MADCIRPELVSGSCPAKDLFSGGDCVRVPAFGGFHVSRTCSDVCLLRIDCRTSNTESKRLSHASLHALFAVLPSLPVPGTDVLKEVTASRNTCMLALL